MKQPLIAELIAIGRLGHSTGMFRARAGNISARLPDGSIIITRAATHKGLLSAADVLHLAADGTPLEAGQPSSETALHLAAYAADASIEAVLHAHPLACVVLSHRNLALNVDLAEEGRPVLGQPPLLDDAPREGRNQAWGAAVQQGTRAALLRRHGLVVAGTNLRDVWSRAELCEWLAELQLRLLEL